MSLDMAPNFSEIGPAGHVHRPPLISYLLEVFPEAADHLPLHVFVVELGDVEALLRNKHKATVTWSNFFAVLRSASIIALSELDDF